MPRPDLSDLLTLAGLALIGAGLWLWQPAAALVFAGVAVMVAAGRVEAERSPSAPVEE